MVINNPTENDYALVRNGYPDYVRELVWTTEVGKDGTEHIQAYVKLQRSQRMSFIKKLFPRGHFKPIDKAEYDLNTRRYAQKDDDTTAGQHRQTFNDPIPANDTLLYQVVLWTLGSHNKWLEQLFNGSDTNTLPLCVFTDFYEKEGDADWKHYLTRIKETERMMVRDKAHLEKLLVSPTYTRIKKDWLKEITYRTIKNAYDDSRIEQDAGGQVVEVDLPTTEDDQEADEDGDGSQLDTDSEAGSESASGSDGTDSVCSSDSE